MYIPQETIQLVRDRAELVEIIKRYVPTLKKKGNNYVGLCPFHKEKTPSFTVSPDKDIFHCFGCNISGNVFSFIEKIERLTYPESVKFVAQIAGVEIAEDDKNRSDNNFDRIHEMNYKVMELYHNYLKDPAGKIGLDYLLKRGVSKASIVNFKMGFAPDAWNFLSNKIKSSSYDLDNALKTGLVSLSRKSGTDHYFDRFRNRVMFPIFDASNKVIAFGGRIIDAGEPKYLNSPESEVFQKRNVLYGFNFAKNHIRELNRAIVVEGYLDVIGCHQSGIKNVVAPLGTALTSGHVQMLARFCGEIILLFDADSAGIHASLRSADIADDISVHVKIAALPSGDPFEYILEKGPREFMSVVDSALDPVDFKISRILTGYSDKNRIEILIKLFNLINSLKMETEKNFYVKKISSHLGIDENALRADFIKFTQKGDHSPSRPLNEKKGKDKGDFFKIRYRDLILLLVNYPDFINKAVIDFAHHDWRDPLSGTILKKIFELHNQGFIVTLDKMFDFFNEGLELEFLNNIAGEQYFMEKPEAVYTEIYINIKLHEIDEKISKYAGIVKNNAGNNTREYITELEILRREKEKLSHYIYNL